MSTQDISKIVEAIVRTLCGTSRSDRVSKQRRIFQLKFWLLDEGADDLRSLRAADRLFAALYVSDAISKFRRDAQRHSESTKVSAAIAELLEDEVFAIMVDRGFSSEVGFSSISEIAALSYKTASLRYQAKMASVNRHTELCIRLHLAGKKIGIKAEADKLYRLAADLPKSKLRKDIRTVRTDVRQRLAFLYVFYRNPGMLYFPAAAQEMWTTLQDDTWGADVSQTIFSRCAMVQGVIARGNDIQRSDLERWTGCAAAAPPGDLKPVSDEELRAAHEHFEQQEGR